MPSSLPRVVRTSVRSVQNMIGQIVVSVAAAVCVGFITNAYFEEKPASPAPAAVRASQQTAVDAETTAVETTAEPSKIIVADDGSAAMRDRAPSRPLSPTAVASPIRNVAETPMPMPLTTNPVETLAGNPLPVLPSQTIADLPVRDIDSAAEGAEIFPGVPSESTLAAALRNAVPTAEQKPERRRFLGLPLPYFVPTASDIVESASAAGGKIVSMVERE
jgi:hypothetical protein